jgi:mRNA m6A methyltransferase catalytic subunit
LNLNLSDVSFVGDDKSKTRKLELFALNLPFTVECVTSVDGCRQGLKAAYLDVEVQPVSPLRASAMEVNFSVADQTRGPLASTSKSTATQFAGPAAPATTSASEEEQWQLMWTLSFY